MKNECRTLEDDFLNDWSIQKSLNELLGKEVSRKWGHNLARNTYSVPSSRDLIPPHMVNDAHDHDVFTVKKGLILYHMTIYDDTLPDFDYPRPGSFFSTTPRHGIYIAFYEKRKEVLDGMDDPLGEDYSEQDMYDFLTRHGYDHTIKDEEFGAALADILPVKTKVKIYKYQLKKDLLAIDDAGDNRDCEGLKADGVVAGYYHLGFNFKNLNEIKICKGPLSEYLLLLETYNIPHDMIRMGLESDLTDTLNMDLIWSSICTDVTPGSKWRFASSDLGRLYLYEYLKDKKDLYFRLSLFTNKHVYALIINDIVQAVLIIKFIPEGVVITGWYNLNNLRVFNNIKYLVESFQEKYNLMNKIMIGQGKKRNTLYLDDELYHRLNKE